MEYICEAVKCPVWAQTYPEDLRQSSASSEDDWDVEYHRFVDIVLEELGVRE